MEEAFFKQHGAILANLPVIIAGLLVMLFALLLAPFPPDYVGDTYGITVTHQDRLAGSDIPETLADGTPAAEVQRPPRYNLRRVVDGMAYFALFQGILAVVGLAFLGERNLFLLLIVSGFFSFVYSAFLGLVLGPMLLATGSLLVFWGALLGWLTTRPLRRIRSHSTTTREMPVIVEEV